MLVDAVCGTDFGPFCGPKNGSTYLHISRSTGKPILGSTAKPVHGQIQYHSTSNRAISECYCDCFLRKCIHAAGVSCKGYGEAAHWRGPMTTTMREGCSRQDTVGLRSPGKHFRPVRRVGLQRTFSIFEQRQDFGVLQPSTRTGVQVLFSSGYCVFDTRIPFTKQIPCLPSGMVSIVVHWHATQD